MSQNWENCHGIGHYLTIGIRTFLANDCHVYYCRCNYCLGLRPPEPCAVCFRRLVPSVSRDQIEAATEVNEGRASTDFARETVDGAKFGFAPPLPEHARPSALL